MRNQIKYVAVGAVVVGLVISARSGLASCGSCGSGEKPHDHAATAADSAQKEKNVIPYPLDTCLVSGEKLGEMGKPPSLIHEGQEIKFCCKGCVKDFNKDPQKYMKKLADEVQKQKAQAEKPAADAKP